MTIASLFPFFTGKEDEVLEGINELLEQTRFSDFKLTHSERSRWISVSSKYHHKGTFVESQLRRGQYDFGLAIGDEEPDSRMFQEMHQHGFISVAVGPNAHSLGAMYQFRDHDAVLKLLRALSD